MSEPQQQMTHVQIPVELYQAALEVLQEQPFKKVSGVLTALQQSAKPVFAGPPGQIVDPGLKKEAE